MSHPGFGRRPAYRRLGLLELLVPAILLVLLQILWPQLDMQLAHWFYDPQRGFPVGEWLAVKSIYYSITWASRLLTLGLLVIWIGYRRHAKRRAMRRAAGFALTALLLGPGLLVNVVLKDHWGRARPFQTIEFGGTHRHTPALQPSIECPRNCAFVSGHASMGFYVAILFYIGRRRHPKWLLAGVLAGCAVGAARMAAGSHYLSDILWAYPATMLGIVVAYLLTHRPRLLWRLARARRRAAKRPSITPATGPRSDS